MLAPPFQQPISHRETEPKSLLFSAKRKASCDPMPEKKFNYKLALYGSELLIIPTESYLREKVAPLQQHLLKSSGILLKPYRGKEEENEDLVVSPYLIHPPEVQIQKMVNQLPIFETYGPIPDMKNGHCKNFNNIERAYTIELEENEPVAAIFFAIYPETKQCEVAFLGVDERYQGKGLGPILLQVALLISFYSGCNEAYLSATPQGMNTYLRHGFYFESSRKEASLPDYTEFDESELEEKRANSDSMNLRISDESSCDLLQEEFDNRFSLDILNEIDESLTLMRKVRETMAFPERVLKTPIEKRNPVVVKKALAYLDSVSSMVKIPQEVYDLFDRSFHEKKSQAKRARLS